MLKPLNKWIRRAVLLPLTALTLAANAQAQTVTIGVQSMFAPWKNAIAQKEFENATGWDSASDQRRSPIGCQTARSATGAGCLLYTS